MRFHPERRQHIVESIEAQGIEEIALGMRHHHEHFDGSGYPDGLAAESIPFISSVIAIADAYDSLATPQYYRAAHGHEAIMDIMHKESGVRFDPAMLAMFDLMIADSSRKAASTVTTSDIYSPKHLSGE